MSRPNLVDEMKQQFGDTITDCDLQCIDPWIGVAADGLVEVCKFLKGDSDLKFDLLNCITAVDYLHTDPKKAATALKWAVREMEERYRAMSQLGVRNIAGYNTKVDEYWGNSQDAEEDEIPTIDKNFDAPPGSSAPDPRPCARRAPSGCPGPGTPCPVPAR